MLGGRPWVEASSEQVGSGDRFYYVAKYRIRKQWALMAMTSRTTDVAAYFRSEREARNFATTFGLKVTDW